MTLSRKGKRTEAALHEAARHTFTKKGYLKTKTSDITTAAGRSAGSFYNYYDNKEQLLAALLEEFSTEVVSASLVSPASDPAEGVRTACKAYWTNYKLYLPEMIGLFQMSMSDAAFRDRWIEHRRAGIEAILKGLKRADGTGPGIGLPIGVLASALVSMLEGFCWTWLAAGGESAIAPPSDEDAIETLSTIWYRTVYGNHSH